MCHSRRKEGSTGSKSPKNSEKVLGERSPVALAAWRSLGTRRRAGTVPRRAWKSSGRVPKDEGEVSGGPFGFRTLTLTRIAWGRERGVKREECFRMENIVIYLSKLF